MHLLQYATQQNLDLVEWANHMRTTFGRYYDVTPIFEHPNFQHIQKSFEESIDETLSGVSKVRFYI